MWFRLAVLSIWACRTEEMTGIYGEIGGMALRNCTGRDRQGNFDIRSSLAKIKISTDIYRVSQEECEILRESVP